MKTIYIITLDCYTEDTGYTHEVILATDSYVKAKLAFDRERDYARTMDIDDNWTIEDDYEDYYFSYNKMPEYFRLKLTTTTLY